MDSAESRLAAAVDRVVQGDPRALARAITVLENEAPTALALAAALYPHTGRAITIGLTGAPGSGKSTLADALIRLLRGLSVRVAVLAVDPSSPLSGGAVLGDRVRMGGYASDPGVYIRSMAARGHLGGLARAADVALLALDAAGWPVIIVETVGVGQSEVEVAGLTDVTAVVLTPAAGDAVQTLKAGLLEVASVFVVNKCDLPGATTLIRDLRALLAHRGGAAPPIVETAATADQGIAELWAALQSRRAHHDQQGRRRAVAAQRVAAAALTLLQRDLATRIADQPDRYATLLDAVAARSLDPTEAAARLLAQPPRI